MRTEAERIPPTRASAIGADVGTPAALGEPVGEGLADGLGLALGVGDGGAT